jgi:hypothetical protein
LTSLKYVSVESGDFYIVTLGSGLWFEPGNSASDKFLLPGFELDSITTGGATEIGGSLVLVKIECRAGEITTTIDWEGINILAVSNPRVLDEIRSQLQGAGLLLKDFNPEGGQA